MRYYLAVLLLLLIFLVPWISMNYPQEVNGFLSAVRDTASEVAAVILSHNPRSISDIKAKYASTATPQPSKVRVLIVPGHEPGFGGAEFGSLKERDMTVELGQDLQLFLDRDPHYQTFITRNATSWTSDFADYFSSQWNTIIEWTKASRAEESALVKVGAVSAPVSKVYHNNAPADVAYRLFGITKWANEHAIDITIHIHFNDYPGHRSGVPGEYSGFVIYVPAKQFGNSTTTKAIALNVFKRLEKYNPVSDLPGESEGVVDEPELIAIGADNTADSASMLIEYGYLYEQQFQDPAVREAALRDLAYQTYLGLQDFFDPNNAANLAKSYDTLMIPHSWKSPMTADNAVGTDVFALQTALHLDGLYPPADTSKNDCPRTGKLGVCTKTALASFQKKYGISGEKDIAGTNTIQMLNQLYGHSQ